VSGPPLPIVTFCPVVPAGRRWWDGLCFGGEAAARYRPLRPMRRARL